MFSRNETASILEAVREVARLREQVEALRADIERLKPIIDRPVLTIKKDARKNG